MKIGDYVRFYDRDWTEIGQIVDEVEDSHLKVVKCKDDYYDLDNFIKSSPNIIDLIEVGDVVTIKSKYCDGNIYKVIDKGKGVVSLDCFQDGFMNVDNEDIKSIVTKEQFENMEYKVGD